MDRKQLAAKTSVIGLASKIISILFNFISRYFFVRYLGAEILGLEGVIKDCVSLLALTDIGIDVAMTYRLYAVVNSQDYKKINDYLTVYQFAYRMVMIVIAILGIVGAMILRYTINGVSLHWPFIYAAYIIQIVSVEASYFIAYKRTFLNADQKKHIQIIVDTAVGVIANMIKIYFIVFHHSYLGYLCTIILQNIVSNYCLNYYIKEYYPKIKLQRKVDKSLVRELFSDTRHILGNKIAGFVYSSTDNFLVSFFLGTSLVGILSNYKMVFSTLSSLLIGFTSPITTIVGSYLNSECSVADQFSVLVKYSFVRYVFGFACILPAYVIGQEFILIYAGKEWIMSNAVLALLCCDFMICCMYGALGDFSAGLGIFSKQKYVSFVGATVNLSLSVLLINSFGVLGVLVGTVVSQIILWIGNWIIVNNALGYDRKCCVHYWLKQFKWVSVLIISIILGKYLCRTFQLDNNIIDFLTKALLLELFAGVILFLLFRKEEGADIIISIKKATRRKTNG